MWTGQMEMHQVSSQQMQLNHMVWTEFLCDYITWYMYLSTFYCMYLCLSNWKITLYLNLNHFLLVMSHSCSWVNPYCNGTYYRTASCGTQTVDSMTSIIKTTIWNTLVSLKPNYLKFNISITCTFSALIRLGVRKSMRPVKNELWGVGYLSGARCRLFAYGPADATPIPKPHHLLPDLNSDWFYLSCTGLPRLSWKRGR